jgi:iron complex outermembrane recepter protein
MRDHVSKIFVAALLTVLVLAGTGAHAQSATQRYGIPAGDLGTTLTAFATQNHMQISFPPKLVKGKQSHAVSGAYAPAEALKELLSGSGLEAVAINPSTFVLKTATAGSKLGPTQVKPDTADVLVESQQPKEKPFSGMNVDIPRTIDDVQPYTIFDSETIEQSGATNIEDFLKQRLTMNTVAQTNSQVIGGNASSGGNTSTINLRGLGTNETLILVDGRRMAGVNISSGNGGVNQPDINGIPLAAIDRIEILPSSASGIYGGSAVGGVVNIILKKNYTGGDVRVSYDRPTSGDAPIRTLTATYGTGFEDGKSHVMVTAQYSDSQPLYVGDRANLIDRGYATILKNDPSFLGYDPTLTTAAFPLLGATPNIFGYNSTTGAPANLTLKGTNTAFNCPTATLPVGYSATSNPSTIIPCKWNLGLPEVNQPPTGLLTPLGSNPKVESLTATFTREMNDRIEFFADGLFASNKSFQEVSQLSLGEIVSSTSPFNPFNQSVFVTLPDDFTTPFNTTSTTYTATMGFKVDLSHHWNSEMDYTWSKNTFESSSYGTNFPYPSPFSNGPLNPFVDTLAHPLDLDPYLTSTPFNGSDILNDVAFRAAGPVGTLPWGDPQLNFGLEHRKENTPGSVLPTTDAPGSTLAQSTIYFPQSQSTDSLYVEGTVPLVTSKNAIPGIKSVDLQVTDRIERYSVNAGSEGEITYNTTPPSYQIVPTPPNANANGYGGTPLQSTATYSSNNQTIGLKYEPIDDVIVRASHATAFLPPTPIQLLVDPVVTPNGTTITDPKTGGTYQVNTISGGNASLTPQSSKNWDLGLIYEPKEDALKGLRVNLEYYQIEQFNYITSLTGDQILNDPGLASRVTRSPTTGLVTLINESLINATEFKTEGFDFALDYRMQTAVGTYYFHLAATRMEHNLQQYSVGAPDYELAGAPIPDGGSAKWKGNGSVNWAYRNWNLGWNVTWFGSYPQQGYPADPIYGSIPSIIAAQGGDYIPSQIYHDFFAGYTFNSSSGATHPSLGSTLTDGISIQLGIKNVFNTLPPLDVSYGPFYASPYGDLRLRDVWLTVKKTF